MWVYHNQNPLKREVNDCVIRSISLAQNKSWNRVYDELSEYAKKEATLLDDVTFVEPYLNDRYNKVCYRCNKCKTTLKEFIDTHKQGVYLVTMKGHITCVIDGVLYDTWDCRERYIWCAWEIKKG